MLALLDRGHSFFAIGGLIAVREVCVNIFEIPSGALADGFGRRYCMVLSMASYVVAYILLGFAVSLPVLAFSMVLIGLGDAFRSGTHKALIYAWLRHEGRAEERTKVYGLTRSWSKIGSACSALLGGVILIATPRYDWVFFASALPSAVNLVNLALYPAYLDPPKSAERSGLQTSWGHVRSTLSAVWGRASLRRCVVEGMVVEGSYAAVKDYIQPTLQAAAMSVAISAFALSAEDRTHATIAVVSCALFLCASASSRYAHRLEERAQGPQKATRLILYAFALCFALFGLAAVFGQSWVAGLLFIAFAVGQNLWKPIHIGRFDREEYGEFAATLLSVESQAKALASGGIALGLGALMDWTTERWPKGSVEALWPVALVGVLVAVVALWPVPRGREGGEVS